MLNIELEEQRQRLYLHRKDDKIKALEREVQLLKSELAEAKRKCEKPRPSEALEGSVDGDLRIQYNVLAHEYERVTKARSILESRCRRYKEMLQEWRDYCKIWIEKKGPRSTAPDPALSPIPRGREEGGDLEAPAPSAPPSKITPMPPERETEPQPGEEYRLSRANEHPERPASKEVSGSSIDRLIGQPAKESPRLKGVDESKAPRISEDGNSRPTTADSSRKSNGVGESHSVRDFPASNHIDDDTPVVISERALKRKRTSVKAEPEVSIHVDDNIKIEAGSKSPVLEVSSHSAPRIQDSLDLDDVGRSFDTPRKRQRLERMRLLSKYGDDLKLHTLIGEENEIQHPERDLMNEELRFFYKPWNSYGRSSEPSNHPVILGPKDPNALPRTSHRKPRSVAPSRRDNGAAAVPILAEDGDAYTPSKHVTGTTQMLDAPGTYIAGAELRSALSDTEARLDRLLQQSSSAKNSFLQNAPDLQSSKDPGSPKTPINIPRGPSVHRAHHQFFTTPRRKSSTEDQLRASTSSKSAIPQSPNSHAPSSKYPPKPPPIHPYHETLRARHPSRLRLSDFKLNKSHTEYAYHESIRKHDEKRKVGGCTDPFCARCKEIARFATLTDFHPPPNPTLFGSSPPASPVATEYALLIDFLGGGRGAKARLDRMTPTERRETLQKAREKSFADLYGRHRQLHQRAVSPPGYWETEFPSTQQEMENREAAKAIERVRVKERWEDALRGGKWKFADE